MSQDLTCELCRVVFNPYFGASLPLVPDRTLRHVFDMQPFILSLGQGSFGIFDDITRRLTGRGAGHHGNGMIQQARFWSNRCDQS